MEEDKPEALIEEVEEEEEEEEEVEDDGPPPGFQCIINPPPPPPPPQQAEELEADGDVDEDEDEDEDEAEAEAEEMEEGPPPGFDAVVPNPPAVSSPIPSPEVAKSTEPEEEDDEDGPPPGWGLTNLANALPEPQSNEADTSDVKMENNEDLDEGPPPGWETSVPHQQPLASTPPLQLSPTVSSDIEKASNQTTRIDNEMPPPVVECTSMPRHSSPAESPVQKPLPSELPSDTGNKEDDRKIVDNRPPVMLQPSSPLQQLPPTPRPAAPAVTKTCPDKAQLVCGTCRKLCVYPRGTKWVQCPGCQEVNFVLEAHQVGQVNCGGCTVLLMYPHGAPAVQCSSCCAVTEVGAHNRRPPLNLQIQQAQRRHRSVRGVR